MHVVQRPVRVRRGQQRRMYLPSERRVVSGVGLGEVDGLFNIGKMFTRMFTIRPKSFTLKNIAGAVGSLSLTGLTMGLAPKITSQHSKIAQYVGYGELVAGAVVGGVVAAPMIGGALGIGGTAATGAGLTAVGTEAAGSAAIAEALGTGAAATSGGFMGTVGSVFSTVGDGVMSVVKGIGSVLPAIGPMLGGGGGGVIQQDQSASDAYAQQYANAQNAAAQVAQAQYDAQVRAQQAAMYTPGYSPKIPYVSDQYSGNSLSPSVGGSYGDLRTPYTAIPEDGGPPIAIDPATGEPVPTSVWTLPMWIGGATTVLLLGMYAMSDDK